MEGRGLRSLLLMLLLLMVVLWGGVVVVVAAATPFSDNHGHLSREEHIRKNPGHVPRLVVKDGAQWKPFHGPDEALPSAFDWRVAGSSGGKSPSLITYQRNQHLPVFCGSCWAFASLTALQDRIKIARQGKWPDVILAPQYLLNCGGGSGKLGTCQGGYTNAVYEHLTKHGVPDETCAPYMATNAACTPMNRCKDCRKDTPCTPVREYRTYRVESYGELRSDVEGMKREIFSNGPITCGIYSSPRFHQYTGGILKAEEDHFSTHAVSLIGWGVDKESNTPYWIGRNSWGTYWGEDGGFFRIEMGKNALNVEAECYWGHPLLSDFKDLDVQSSQRDTKFPLKKSSNAAKAKKNEAKKRISLSIEKVDKKASAVLPLPSMSSELDDVIPRPSLSPTSAASEKHRRVPRAAAAKLMQHLADAVKSDVGYSGSGKAAGKSNREEEEEEDTKEQHHHHHHSMDERQQEEEDNDDDDEDHDFDEGGDDVQGAGSLMAPMLVLQPEQPVDESLFTGGWVEGGEEPIVPDAYALAGTSSRAADDS